MKPIFLIVLFILIISSEAFTSRKKSSHENKDADKTIKIGLLIQDNKSVEARYAAELAIKKINDKGGIKGKPLQLIVRTMEGPWGTGSKQAIDLIFNHKVWAIMGSHDGRNAHLVEQACAKTHVVFLSTWTSDPTLSGAFVPWYFSCVPNDSQQAKTLVEEIFNKRKLSKIAIISDKGYDSKLASKIFAKAAVKIQKKDPLQFSYDYLSKDFKNIIAKVEKAKVDGFVLFGQTPVSTSIIQELRQKKIKQPIFCSLSIQGEAGISNSNLKNYDNIILISTGSNTDFSRINFENEFRKMNGKVPGAAAVYAYDGMNLIIEAIKKSYPDQEKLQKLLLNIQYKGITGLIQFDIRGNRQGEIELVEIKNGILTTLKK